MAVMVVAFTTLNDNAFTPPKLTLVAPVRFDPLMVTPVLKGPLVGEKDVMMGGGT